MLTPEQLLSGAQSGNYALANSGANAVTSAKITPASLTVSASANDKVYDGSDVATINLTVTGLKGTDASPGSYSATYTSAAFADINVGTGISVNIAGLSITSTLPVGNYTVHIVVLNMGIQ